MLVKQFQSWDVASPLACSFSPIVTMWPLKDSNMHMVHSIAKWWGN